MDICKTCKYFKRVTENFGEEQETKMQVCIMPATEWDNDQILEVMENDRCECYIERNNKRG